MKLNDIGKFKKNLILIIYLHQITIKYSNVISHNIINIFALISLYTFYLKNKHIPMIRFAHYNVINVSIHYITKMAVKALLKYYQKFLCLIFQFSVKISSDILVASGRKRFP